MSALVQLTNYQIVQPILKLELKSHTLESNSHFIPELTICSICDLTMIYLTHTARFLECQCPTRVVSMTIYFINLFFVFG